MAGSVLVWSLFPPLTTAVGVEGASLPVALGIQVGALLGALTILAVRGGAGWLGVLDTVRGRPLDAAALWLAMTGYVWLYVLSIERVGAVVTVLLVEAWPLVGARVMDRFVHRRRHASDPVGAALTLIAFAGVAAIVLLSGGGAGAPAGAAEGGAWWLYGIPLLAALATGFGTLQMARLTTLSTTPDRVAGAMTVQAVGRAGSVAVLAIALLLSGGGGFASVPVQSLPIGVLVVVGSGLFTASVALAANARVFVVWYLTPVASLAWLVAAGLAAPTAWLLLAAGLVVAANLLSLRRRR